MDGPITALQMLDCDWLVHKFIELNFSKLMDNNEFSGITLIAFVITSVKYHLNDFLEMDSL